MADRPAPRHSPDARSGMEFLHAVRAGRIAGARLWAEMGLTLDEIAPGRVTFRGRAEPRHGNIVGGVHGGWYGTALDSCMATAVLSAVPAGFFSTTLEFRVNITRALPIGTEIIAEGILQHSGRSTGVARGEIRGAADGRLYATGSTTCLILPAGEG